MTETQHRNRRNRHRYRQELVPCRGPRSARCHCAASEVVAWPGGSTACQYAAVPDRHGGLRRRASSQPKLKDTRPRCPADAGEVRAALLEGAEERLPRCGGDRRSGAAADDEVRRDEDRRSTRPAGLHRVRERLVSQRTGIINQIRAFLLERGIAVRQGPRFLRLTAAHPGHPPDVLSPRMVRSSRTWLATGAGSMSASELVERDRSLARQDAGCERLMSVPASGRSSPARWWPRSALEMPSQRP